MKRWIVLIVVTLVGTMTAADEEIPFSKFVKAKLVFREETAKDDEHDPHALNVYLCVENISGSNLRWTSNPCKHITAELLDAAGKPVGLPAGFAGGNSILSNNIDLCVPFGSRLEWLISHGGVSTEGDLDTYAIIVGGEGWLVPKDASANYSLRIKLKGYRSVFNGNADTLETLLDIPPTKIKLTRP